MTASLQLEGVQKAYGKKTVIDHLDFAAEPGEFVVLVGPSGCGKSTILRCVAGLESIQRGRILIDGDDVTARQPKDRNIAMVFQDYALYPHKNVFENIAFGLRIAGIDAAEIDRRVQLAAEKLELSPFLQRRPSALSGGQRQRVAIGRAIVRQPKLFLFDEPLSNLDAKLRGAMRLTIAKLHQELKTSVVYVTHDQVEAMTLADRIVVLEQGQVRQVGAPLDLYFHPANMFVATFIGSPPMNLIHGRLQDEGGKLAFCSDGGLKCTLDDALAHQLRRRPAREVVMGIRPEDIGMAAEGSPDSLAARVVVSEPLGATTSLYTDVAGEELHVSLPPPHRPKRGEAIELVIDRQRLHFFDADSQLSLLQD